MLGFIYNFYSFYIGVITMANTQIDVAMQSDISDIVHTAAGTVTNGVRVVVS